MMSIRNSIRIISLARSKRMSRTMRCLVAIISTSEVGYQMEVHLNGESGRIPHRFD